MESTTGQEDNRERLPIRIVVRLATLMLLLTVVLTLAAFGARRSNLCELAVNWPVQNAVGAGLACCVLLLSRRRKLALLAGTIAAVNASYVAPIFLPPSHGRAVGPECRAVTANILTSNRDTRRFFDFIHAERPDFILVLEVDIRWQHALNEDLYVDYPFSVAEPREDNFGITLLSRHPILSHRVATLDDSGVPTIVATIDFHGRPLNIVGTHPLPPIGRQNWQLRNQHLKALGDLVSKSSRPVIVLGDLNSTAWSPSFRELLQDGGLRDSRQGFGMQFSWPNEPWFLRIPIDHALVSSDLIVTQRNVGPDIGSDHFPIVVAFAREGS